jgi:mannose-6-phosphate isomerase
MLYPLLFRPILKPRIWGGEKLHKVFGKRTPEENNKIGESWELSGLEDSESVVINGLLSGNTITELIEIYMDELVGQKVFDTFGTYFPLLFKFIDANDKLSIQVHPSDEIAQEKHQSYGKTEMWYIIDTEPQSELILGLNKEMDSNSLKESIQNNTLEQYLHRIPVKKGDCFFIPPGLIHAIGKGILLAEIQQASDLTYRLYDYNRLDDKGNPRELHIEKALETIDFSNQNIKPINYEPKENTPIFLMENEYFTTRLLHLTQTIEVDYSDIDSFVVYMCIEGEFDIIYGAETTKVKKGETVLVPAVICELTLIPQKKAELLEVYT